MPQHRSHYLFPHLSALSRSKAVWRYSSYLIHETQQIALCEVTVGSFDGVLGQEVISKLCEKVFTCGRIQCKVKICEQECSISVILCQQQSDHLKHFNNSELNKSLYPSDRYAHLSLSCFEFSFFCASLKWRPELPTFSTMLIGSSSCLQAVSNHNTRNQSVIMLPRLHICAPAHDTVSFGLLETSPKGVLPLTSAMISSSAFFFFF